MRKFLAGVSVGLATTVTAVAQDAPARRPVVAPFYCPPAAPVVPYCPPGSGGPSPTYPLPGGDPNAIPNPAPILPIPEFGPGQPGTPTASEPRPVGPADSGPQFARATGGGGGDTGRYNVNMFADLLGARSVRLSYSVPIVAQFGLGGAATTGSGGSAVVVNPNAPGGFIRFGPTPNGTTFQGNSAFNGGNLTYVQPTGGSAASFDRAFATAALQSLLSTGQLTAAQVLSLQQLSPADRAQLLANRGVLNGQITQATRGLGIGNATVSNVDGSVVGNSLRYTALLTGTQTLALPGTSSTVGRLKMAEDTSPMPRDRVIFTYDSFGDVPLTENGINVNRFQFGVEKTFLDGRWSAEVRLPFAGTLAGTYTQGAEVKDIELGNLRFALKHLWTRSNTLNFTSGLAVTLPTARDQTVLSPLDGSLLYKFRNQSVQVEPFVAALYTPNDRLFAQAWTSMNFEVSGGDLQWNPAVFGGTGSARIWDLPILSVDGQVGYWLIQNGGGAVRGLAPFVELHWNRTIAQNVLTDALNNNAGGLGLNLTSVGAQELNMSTGFLCQVGNNLNLSVGAALPLLQNPERTFNWQIGVRASYYFGRTARERTPAVAVNGF